MYSGKTVEINNCDAEGRLVLAVCVVFITAVPITVSKET
jgi:leucyl aminopeptidase